MRKTNIEIRLQQINGIKLKGSIMRKAIFAIVIMAFSAAVSANQRMTMSVGEIKLLRLNPIERVAVGQTAVLSTSLLKNGQLLLLGEGVGTTTVHLWFESGKETQYTVTVAEQDQPTIAQALNSLLSGIPGVEAEVVGNQVVLHGDVPPEYNTVLDAVLIKYPNVINVTSKVANVVRELLSGVKGIEVSTIGTHVVLRGTVGTYDVPIIEKVAGEFEEIMDLTNASGLASERMIFINVKMTEFDKRSLKELGIDWGNNVAGPSAAFASDLDGNKSFRVPSPGTFDGLPLQVKTPIGYFGIASEITSRINFLVSNNSAMILAEPRLSAVSGGTAEFLAGGEVPLPTTGALGQSNVEFKEFGISMKISPVVDTNDRIRASVETEISTIDRGASVAGIPGFLTRRTATEVSMNAGETLVISGLLDRESARELRKIPGLGDIPILGTFFRQNDRDFTDKELVIFVTPTVYDADSELNKAYIRRSQEKIDEHNEYMNKNDFMILE